MDTISHKVAISIEEQQVFMGATVICPCCETRAAKKGGLCLPCRDEMSENDGLAAPEDISCRQCGGPLFHEMDGFIDEDICEDCSEE